MLLPDQRAENRPELFGLQNFYRPEDIWSRLTLDHRSLDIRLDNNWPDIVEEGIDPIEDVFIVAYGATLQGLISRAEQTKITPFRKYAERHNTTPDEISSFYHDRFDRSQKGYLLLAGLVPSPSFDDRLVSTSSDRSIFLEALKRQGLEFQWVTRKYLGLRLKDYYETQINNALVCLEYNTSNPDIPLYILYTINVRKFEVMTDKEFIDDYNHFFPILEKTIRAIYKIVDQEPPPVKLIIKPNPKETPTENAFSLLCEYCRGSYKSSFDSCTHCGAPKQESYFGG